MIVYKGSFNPLHHGHLAIANYMENKYNENVTFEICKDSFDKETVSDDALKNRLEQFYTLCRDVICTNNKTFLQSCCGAQFYFNKDYKLLSKEKVKFIVGTDTIQRIISPKYYFNSEPETIRVLNKIASISKVSFHLFHRFGHKDNTSLIREIKGLHPGFANKIVSEDLVIDEEISSSNIRLQKTLNTFINTKKEL